MSLETLLDLWNQPSHQTMNTAPSFYASTELVREYSLKSLEHPFSGKYTLGDQFDDDVRPPFLSAEKTDGSE
jgi:hypothetical protein